VLSVTEMSMWLDTKFSYQYRLSVRKVFVE